jgi:DNA invertase Pin-like site-specific DNA recombinase
MSTDHQQYSLDNQADAIARYAAGHSFQVVKTYSDAAKSGLRLKNRAGLKQLLKDVVETQRDFRAILVYDVSRWGRFQDNDEAAHYEYICKSAGVPVHYCMEMFDNEQGGPLALILKAIKRTMAAEYSRDLSVKVRAGQLRLTKLGYKLGGRAPYGLRRLLLDKQDCPKQLLAFGERKSLTNEHVTFAPGPANEVTIVRRIFREFADEHRSVNSIASRLNQDGIPYPPNTTWKGNSLRIVLQDPRYVGIHVWGRTTAPLSTRIKRLPVSQWIVYANAFKPILSQDLFLRAQERFANFTIRLSNEELLDRLRRLYQKHGKLTKEIIDRWRLCPGLTTYHHRFGGLLNAYALIGYEAPEARSYVSLRQRGIVLRDSFIKTLLYTFAGPLQAVRKNRRYRPVVRYRRTGLLISVVFARHGARGTVPSWIIETPRAKRNRITLLALLDVRGGTIEALRVLPKLPSIHRHMRVKENDDWFRAGLPVQDISDLLEIVKSVQRVKGNATEKRLRVQLA